MSDTENNIGAVENGELLIQADNLVKSYRGRCVVKGVSLTALNVIKLRACSAM